MSRAPRRVAVVGAGWAGVAAAVRLVERGAQVTVFEAARTPGGRARTVELTDRDGATHALDNGQHILIGAYRRTLALMRTLGVRERDALLRLPLTLRFADGLGLALPKWPTPFDVVAGIVTAKGWTASDKFALARAALGWHIRGYKAAPTLTVDALCARLPRTVREGLIDPLCVSALNTPATQASAAVFLRVLRDAMFSVAGASNLLLPRRPLGALLPEAGVAWLRARGAEIRLGHRVGAIASRGATWAVDGEPFDAVVLATSPWDASRLVADAGASGAIDATVARNWSAVADGLRFEAIACVYLFLQDAAGQPARLSPPMLALREAAGAPAQFVFDRGQLGGPAGLFAFVVSASEGDREHLEDAVLRQALSELAPLGVRGATPLRTVIEKRATFTCTPGLVRPKAAIAPGLVACGDYLEGPYPATLEGAVMSAEAAAKTL